MTPKNKMSIDIETRSEVNLATVGATAYALHPTTKIQCIAFKYNDGKVWVITPKGRKDFLDARDFESRPMAEFFLKKWQDKTVELHAWNESFERILFHVLGPALGIPLASYKRWHCTQVRALYYNLPGKLKTCANALPIAEKKDMSGNLNMLQLCKPRPAGHRKGDRPEKFITRNCDDPKYGPAWRKKYEKLYEYCRQDVVTESAISDFLKPIPAHENNLFNFDKRMNATGLCIDIKSVIAAQKVEKIYKAELVAKFEGLTRHHDEDDKVVQFRPSQRAKVLEYWNELFNLDIKDTTKETIEKVLRRDLDPVVREQIEVFQEAGKTALSKLAAFKRQAVNPGKGDIFRSARFNTILRSERDRAFLPGEAFSRKTCRRGTFTKISTDFLNI